MQVAKTVYGIKKPKYCSDKTVLSYSRNLGIETNIYRIEEFNGRSRDSFKLKKLPELRIYNPHGLRVNYEISCSADYHQFMTLSPNEIADLPSSGERYSDWIPLIYNVSNQQPFSQSSETNKPLFVVTYARFIGKLNKDHTLPWIEYLQERDDIELLVLNVDISIED